MFDAVIANCKDHVLVACQCEILKMTDGSVMPAPSIG